MMARAARAAVARHAVATPPEAPKDDPDLPSEPVLAPPAPRRRHLEGLLFYVFYISACVVCGVGVALFMQAVDRLFYGDSD